MVRIELATLIKGPIERCFDLARSIDLHVTSTDWTRERAISGTTSGLIEKNQEVTWRGSHFGIYLQHTSRITEFNRPHYFQDCMVRGAFQWFCHDHHFRIAENGTVMTDLRQFRAPLGVLGLMAQPLLERHMRNLLNHRNECIKRTAEGEAWRQFLNTAQG